MGRLVKGLELWSYWQTDRQTGTTTLFHRYDATLYIRIRVKKILLGRQWKPFYNGGSWDTYWRWNRVFRELGHTKTIQIKKSEFSKVWKNRKWKEGEYFVQFALSNNKIIKNSYDSPPPILIWAKYLILLNNMWFMHNYYCNDLARLSSLNLYG